MNNPTVIAGYWDRVANHNSEMQQYLASLEEMTGQDYTPLRNQMKEIQKIVSIHRATWQSLMPKGHG